MKNIAKGILVAIVVIGYGYCLTGWNIETWGLSTLLCLVTE
jgi:hypothetical protein